MLNFLNHLSRAADSFIDRIDEQLGSPVLHTMNGDVFTHGIGQTPRGSDAPVSITVPVDHDAGDTVSSTPDVIRVPLSLTPDAVRA